MLPLLLSLTLITSAPKQQQEVKQELRVPTQAEQIQLWISLYSLYYNIDENKLRTTIKCESNFNPKAYNGSDPNGGSKGIAQFQSGTFYNYSKFIEIEKPDVWNAEHSIKTMAYMFLKGQQNQWSCYRKNFGSDNN